MARIPHDDFRSDDFELSLDDMLERVNASSREDQATREGQPAAERRAPASAVATAAVPSDAPSRAPAEPATPGGKSVLSRIALPVLVVLGLAATAIGVMPPHRVRDTPPMAYERLPSPSAGRAVAPRAPAATIDQRTLPSISSDADASTESMMLEQLDGQAPATATSPATASAQAPQMFSIARYDALRSRDAGWRVLAPLHVEEVHVLVPIDSPLKSMSDLRGRRINVGERGSARSRSGRALYDTLFGQPLPASDMVTASRDVALQSLLRGRSIDALMFFDGQPSTWLATLPAATRARLRLLKFAPEGSAGRRALRTYLPAFLAPMPAQDHEPVVTLGEVTFLVGKVEASDAGAVLEALCRRLPGLRSRGHPKWKEVDPTLQLPLDVQRMPDLDQASLSCAASVAVASNVPS